MTKSTFDGKQKQEVVALLKRIGEGATSSQVSLSEVLRLCMRLARVLNNNELNTWAVAEASGYKDRSILPDYRIFETNVYGTFSGQFGKRMDNAPIPRIVIDKDHHSALFTIYLTQPVGELERLARSGGQDDALSIAWSGDTIAYYQQRSIYQGYVLVAAAKVTSTGAIGGTLEVIRTRVLEFVLAIENELGVDVMTGDDKSSVEAPRQERITQIFNTTIQGGENVTLGSSGTINQQVVHVQPGDLLGLKQQLEKLGITPELVSELETALDKDQQSAAQPGPATQGWLGRVMIMVGKGTLKLASTAATTVITAEVRRFLGLPPI